MRSILYSPGYGGGWTSWHHGSDEERRFALEYAPFIEAVRARTDRVRPVEKRGADLPDDVRAALRKLRSSIGGWTCTDEDDRYVEIPVDLLPLFVAFIEEWSRRFPGKDIPYTGGMAQLRVMDVPDGSRVRITEYDGSESVEVEGAQDGWL